MNNKLLCFLGLTRKSGNLYLGMNTVKNNLKKILLILVTKDISENSFEEINFISRKNNINIKKINYIKDDINIYIGKYSAVIGVSDKNFVDKINNLISQEELHDTKI